MERIEGREPVVLDVGRSGEDRIHVTAHVQQGSRIRDDSSFGFVQCCATCLLSEFFRCLPDVRKLGTEGLKRIVLDRNEFDTLVDLDDTVAVTVSLSDLFREGQTSTIVQRCFGHASA